MRHDLFLLPMFLLACTDGPQPLDEAAALERGGRVVPAAFAMLSGRLQHAVQEGGPAHAVDVCSREAVALLDSLGRVEGMRIRRTSDRIRAPHDEPDVREAMVLRDLLAQVAKGVPADELEPRVVADADSVSYYHPILISMPTCLRCHGKPGSDIAQATLAAISARYPLDGATGYELGDLRGIWSLRWKR
ncbi:MAG: DUF3365 domain-containing protein [Flavobacteriales bacterium]